MKTVPIEEVPEVAAYQEAEDALQAYLVHKADVVSTIRSLIEEVNTKAQAADKAVRARGVFCGPWKKHNTKTEVDTDKLVEGMGLQNFLAIGGTSTTEVVYEIDKKKLEIAIANGTVPKPLADIAVVEKISYSKPKERVL